MQIKIDESFKDLDEMYEALLAIAVKIKTGQTVGAKPKFEVIQ
jgi:hypothetical protein